ncbi:MAG TPA: hypothetical protein DDX93_00130 [Smithella sp.]|jgi:NADPH:quinone reductase-like Zn-dependent oxidoreductase|nr:hypothetical protein [Smithella sp.]
MKKIFIMIIAAAVVYGLSSLAFADTITKIEGNKITVMDNAGKVKTIESNVKGLKVGDKVKLTTRNGLTWLNPQPEPPKPAVEINPRGSIQKNAVPTTPEQPTPPPPSQNSLGQMK